ncbi:NAD(P)-dependent oxidoreductase [Alloscardovia criceti]|uniref:NAD(P)-dependent oxidoreductase n=1 Tax=Alloscardovia criceti TaxID=356828 RepID=UPI00035E1240|nr:NAD(P)-dependent oxidoreductase [Alloscardovia criceti]
MNTPIIIGVIIPLDDKDLSVLASKSGIELRTFIPHAHAQEVHPVSTVELDPRELAECDVLIGWNAAVLEAVKLPESRIAWIQLWSAGADYVPKDQFRDRSVVITTGSGSNSQNIAQQVLAYMLMFVRQLHQHTRYAAQHTWKLVGGWTELTEKRLLVLGTGEIGREVARLAHAFGMTTVGINHNGHKAEHFDEVHATGHGTQALAQADFVVNALPLTRETENSVDKDFFAHMKSSAYYINVGRGKSTVQSDLVDALKNNSIAGAALDVFEEEPLDTDNIMWTLDNVIITPHTAGYSDLYAQRVLQAFLANLDSFVMNGAPDKHVFNFAREY